MPKVLAVVLLTAGLLLLFSPLYSGVLEAPSEPPALAERGTKTRLVVPSWKKKSHKIVDSVAQPVLDSGVVGHFPGTGPVGEGNYALAGHIVTHGEPFAELPSLDLGSKVIIQKGSTEYVFRVVQKFVVDHTDTSVLDYQPKTLTLITCNSRFFRTDERLVVRATLVEVRS